jgi:hypothetical protein
MKNFNDALLELTNKKTEINNWDDLVDPNKKDYKELLVEAINESIQAIENSDFILSIKKYTYEDGDFREMD